MTLKNALNMGDQLLCEAHGERLVLTTKWEDSYKQFDSNLSHFGAQGEQVHCFSTVGVFETAEAVNLYAKEHDFGGEWQIVNSYPQFRS